MADHDALVAQFLSITNAAPSEAEHLLEASGWDLDSAVQLHFDGVGSGATAAPAATGMGDYMEDLDDMVNNARAAATRVAPSIPGPDGVRAADAVRRERLVSNLRPHRPSVPHVGPEVTRLPFGDLDPNAASRSGPGLETIYQPPSELLCGLPLNEMKHTAERDDKWILLNVQDLSIFASLQLNADLWKNSVVQDVVKGSFLFSQSQVPSREATQLQEQYDLSVLPAVFIVDPNTGQKMHEWRGRLEADRFLEDVSPFLDIPPSDSRAGTLVSSSVKQLAFQNRHAAPAPVGTAGIVGVSNEDEELNKVIEASMSDPSALAAIQGASQQAPSSHAVAPSGEWNAPDEDAELAAAIAASLGDNSGSDPTLPSAGPTQPLDSAGPMATESPAERKASAEARLPPEPRDSSNACRVAIQTPGGRRMRMFDPGDPVGVLYDFTLTQLTDEEAGGQFLLVPAVPGSAPLTDHEVSLRDAGVAGGMLRLKWND